MKKFAEFKCQKIFDHRGQNRLIVLIFYLPDTVYITYHKLLILFQH